LHLGNKGFPKIIKLDDDNLEAAQEYSHLNISAIMNIMDCTKVVKVLEGVDSVLTAKIIPLLTYLVPLFMNGGKPLTAITVIQVFMENFYKTASIVIKAQAQYILNFCGWQQDVTDQVIRMVQCVNLQLTWRRSSKTQSCDMGNHTF